MAGNSASQQLVTRTPQESGGKHNFESLRVNLGSRMNDRVLGPGSAVREPNMFEESEASRWNLKFFRLLISV